MGNYDSIIHMQRPKDTKHKPMSMHNRAAQFAPFDALTGFGGKITETARLTSKRIDLSEDEKALINDQLLWIDSNISLHPTVSVTYFVPDGKKEGGSYQTLKGTAFKVNRYEELLILETTSDEGLSDRNLISFHEIIKLEIP